MQSEIILESRNFSINYDFGNKYVVHVANGISLSFNKLSGGTMYICVIKARAEELSCVADGILLSATVGERMRSYTRREQSGISKVLDLLRSLGYPSRKELISAIRNGVIVYSHNSARC